MTTLRTVIEAPAGYRSDRVARFMWQLDAQRRLTLDTVSGLDAAALGWQPAPGMNTIGMLLAHIAYAECHLTQVGIEGKATSDTRAVIGIGEVEEGMPLAPDAPPAPALAGKDLGYYTDMLARSRSETRRVAAALDDAALAREVVRQRPDGSKRVFNVEWVFYHLLEHEAGHRGQIALLGRLRGVC